MSLWLVMLGMGAVTYLARALPLLTLRRVPGTWLARVLRQVPPAIFAALLVPALLAPEGRLEAGPTLWAAAIGAAVAWRTASMPLTVLAGLTAFALFGLLGG